MINWNILTLFIIWCNLLQQLLCYWLLFKSFIKHLFISFLDSSKLEFIKKPIYNITQLGDITFGKRSKFLGVFGTTPRITSSQAKSVSEAKKLAMTESIKIVLMKQSAAHQQQRIIHQRTQVQRQQAICLMCRVYVGSISFELKEDTIKAAFLQFGPIRTINMSYDMSTQKHKGFAFVEWVVHALPCD